MYMYMYLFVEEFKVVPIVSQCLGIHLNLRESGKNNTCVVVVVFTPLTQKFEIEHGYQSSPDPPPIPKKNE